ETEQCDGPEGHGCHARRWTVDRLNSGDVVRAQLAMYGVVAAGGAGALAAVVSNAVDHDITAHYGVRIRGMPASQGVPQLVHEQPCEVGVVRAIDQWQRRALTARRNLKVVSQGEGDIAGQGVWEVDGVCRRPIADSAFRPSRDRVGTDANVDGGGAGERCTI